jgi:alkanesulfonate monooxygenase SsuD/methylene tetrahydromethanopterin reductase-like flavin-dependent oxidoreductase (luciferase family)
MLRGPAICGSPAEVSDRILAMRELLGLDLHLSMFDLGGLPPERLRETLELFGNEVLPALGRATR